MCTNVTNHIHRWRDRYHEIEDKYRPYQIQIDALMDANSGLKDQTELALSEV